MKKLICFTGFIGSGKSTAAEYIVNTYNYKQLSFGEHLKDVISAAFGWERSLLSGLTIESRQWREEVDIWWANRLNIPNLTPRWVMQTWGTDLIRNKFHNDFWIASLERRLEKEDSNIIISDCRFANEIKALRKYNASIYWIQALLPEWYNTAYNELRYLETYGYETGWESEMRYKYPDVHRSEYDWITQPLDGIITNIESLDELYKKLDKIVLP